MSAYKKRDSETGDEVSEVRHDRHSLSMAGTVHSPEETISDEAEGLLGTGNSIM